MMAHQRIPLMASSVLLLAMVVSLSACVGNVRNTGSVQSFLKSGNIAAASKIAEEQDQSQSDVLANMNKGILRSMRGDFKGSNAVLEKAKQRIEELYGISITEQLGAVTINDKMRSYSGDRYEQVLLHAYMALNYIELGQPESARVEMLQADVKMREWGEQPEEDPFVRYLSGIIYEMLGEPDEALVAYRKAKVLYQDSAKKQPIVMPRQLKKDYLRLLYRQGLREEYRNNKHRLKMRSYKPPMQRRNVGEVVVLLHNGLAPVRGENRIQIFATEVEDMVSIALPEYKQQKQLLNKARVRVMSKTFALETVEDVDALARHALDDDMAVITTRAIARAVIKYQSQQKIKEEGGGFAGFLATVANHLTERADTRSWITLPSEIQLVRLSLPAGQHTLSIEILNQAQRVVDKIERTVTVQPRKTTVLSQHWVAPVPVVVTSVNK